EGGTRGWLSVTTTPRGLSSWVYEVFGRERPDVAVFHASTRQNPFLPPDFAHEIRLQYGNNLRAAQELDGRFVHVSGAAWDESYFLESIWFGPDDWPTHDQVVRSVLAIDTSKGKLTGDYQALVLARLDKAARFWIDAEAIRVDEVRLLQRALELIEEWNPDV